MTAVKRYGQFCALARALDEVGDRWTLLVVRELLLGPATWSQLHGRLPGIATNLLSERLVRLQDSGLLVRDDASREYALTDRGLALRPVLHALIAWGAPLMTSGPGDDVLDDRWALLAVEALLTTPAVTGPPTLVLVRCGDASLEVTVDADGRRVAAPSGQPPDAVVTGRLPDVLAAVHAGRPGEGLQVTGRRAAARLALRSATP